MPIHRRLKAARGTDAAHQARSDQGVEMAIGVVWSHEESYRSCCNVFSAQLYASIPMLGESISRSLSSEALAKATAASIRA
jgi:hypothetical protein